MHNSAARFQVVAAGRRSFKTERKKRKLVTGDKYHPAALTMVDGNFFFAAPTHGQAKRIAWKDLKDMTKPYWSSTPSESELVISLKTGSRIFVIGMDQPARIEGMQWHGGILDEYANMKPELWEANVRPVFSDTGGWCDLIGVPEGRNHYYERAEYARKNRDKGWDFFTWKSADVLDPAEIAALMEELDERTYRQEYEASFETLGNLAYDSFSDKNIHPVEFNPKSHLFLCFDFNATIETPFAVIPVQPNGDYLDIPDEFVIPGIKTAEMCDEIIDYLNKRNFRGTLSVTGDHAGNQTRSSAALSDWGIVKFKFKNYPGFKVVTRPTLSIKDRVASANALLKTYSGRRRVRVSRHCKKLIEDWERVEMPLDANPKNLTHPSDAFSYYAYNYHDITARKTEK